MHGLTIVNQIGPLVQQQLRRGGFDVTFYATPDSNRIMANGQCPLVLSGHSGSSIFDPLATLEAYHSKNFVPVGSTSFFSHVSATRTTTRSSTRSTRSSRVTPAFYRWFTKRWQFGTRLSRKSRSSNTIIGCR